MPNWQGETLGLACWLAFSSFGARCAEPTYQSKSLTKWLKVFEKSEPNSAEENRARDAVRTIGTNAIPNLIKMLRSEDLELQQAGKNGFEILGQVGAPAVPELAQLLVGTNELARFWAAQALGEIGAPALPALMAGLTNHHFAVGTDAALGIVKLGTNAAPALPILLKDLQHPDRYHRERAADALGNLHIQPELVVPALANLLRDPSPAACTLALNSLAQFGSGARSAAPLIIPLLTNPDFADAAKLALREIAPEMLTNAPPR